MSRKHGKRDTNVYLVQLAGRCIELKWRDPETGRRRRISTGTYDANEAEELRKDAAASIRCGLDPQPQKRRKPGDPMGWDQFREEYTNIRLNLARDNSRKRAESMLDLVGRIAKPTTLADLTDPRRLREIESQILAGKFSRFGRRRSDATARGAMNDLMAALQWAEEHGYIKQAPRFKKRELAKEKQMKGRPITTEEFERMLAVTPKIVGPAAAPSWIRLLCGLWESALRLDELLHMAWDIPGEIIPEWPRNKRPVLSIPAAKQKNNTSESIPLLPGFEKLLVETPPAQQRGYVFNPGPVFGGRRGGGRGPSTGRPKMQWVSKVISQIGEAANVIVEPANGTPPKVEPRAISMKRDGTPRKVQPKKRPRPQRCATYTPAKFASAHDLRRSCLERMVDTGLPPTVIQMIARHASFETTKKYYAPGKVQAAADLLHKAYDLGHTVGPHFEDERRSVR